MNNTKVIAAVLGIPFSVITAYAMVKVGYLGIFESLLAGPGAWQVFADLVVALSLVLVWMFKDAREKGRNVWPYVVATLFLGSFGPLAYLLFASSDADTEGTMV